MTDFESLKPHCQTEHQTAIIEAITANGGVRPAARQLGITKSTIDGIVRRLELRKAQTAIPEHTGAVPEGFKIKGTSTLYKDGGAVMQWVKTTIDGQKAALIMEEASKAISATLPRDEPISAPDRLTDANLCNLFVITDAHIGSLTWGKETGDDWDLDIAESLLCKCYGRLIEGSPPAKECIIAEIGDFMHFDGLEAVTPTAHNILDSDGRFSKVVQAAVRVLRKVIRMALARHEHVTLLLLEGNHDLASSVWLRVMFSALLENEPRVTVVDTEGPYYAHQFGNTMVGFHHGHLKKTNSLALYLASAFPKVWGGTEYRYAHVGHLHAKYEKEENGMTVTQHQTLTGHDAYAHRHGWLSKRAATSVTYHKDYGQVAQTTISPEMVA